MSNSSEDMAEFTNGDVTVTVTRPHKATPPLNGTFDVEIYGTRVEGRCAEQRVMPDDLHFKN